MSADPPPAERTPEAQASPPRAPPGAFKDDERDWYDSSKLFEFLKPHAVWKGNTFNILSLQGGKYNLPDEKRREFYELYSEERSKKNFSLVELKNDVFPFLADIDHLTIEAMEHPDLWVAIEEEISASIKELLRADDAATCCKWQLRTPSNRHAIWPDCLVTTDTALAVRMRAIERLKERISCVDWSDVLDISVLEANGLRMLGSFKAWKPADLLANHCAWYQSHYGITKDGNATKKYSQKSKRLYNVVNTDAGFYAPEVGGITAETLMRHSVYRPNGTPALETRDLIKQYQPETVSRKRKNGAKPTVKLDRPPTNEAQAVEEALRGSGTHNFIQLQKESPSSFRFDTLGERRCPYGETHSGGSGGFYVRCATRQGQTFTCAFFWGMYIL